VKCIVDHNVVQEYSQDPLRGVDAAGEMSIDTCCSWHPKQSGVCRFQPDSTFGRTGKFLNGRDSMLMGTDDWK
jgi:hypothetical protein